MSSANRRLMRHKHLYDRISEIQKFETFTKLSALYSKLRTSSNIGNLFVSFDELLTELASRGFYCNYDNFKDMEQEEAAILRISTEPFVKKSTNVK